MDLIAKQVAIIGRGKEGGAEQTILQAFLGWNRPDDDDPIEWPSQSDLSPRLDGTRQRIGQVVPYAAGARGVGRPTEGLADLTIVKSRFAEPKKQKMGVSN